MSGDWQDTLGPPDLGLPDNGTVGWAPDLGVAEDQAPLQLHLGRWEQVTAFTQQQG